MANGSPDAILIADGYSDDSTSAKRELNVAFIATIAVAFTTLLLAAIWGPSVSNGLNASQTQESFQGDQIYFTWNEPEYMPRHDECIDPNNGQAAGYEG